MELAGGYGLDGDIVYNTSEGMVKKQKRSTMQQVWQSAKHFLIPHAGNEYRPHAVRGGSLVLLLGLIMAALVGQNLLKTGDVLGQTTRIDPTGLLNTTNTARQEHLRQPLRQNHKLSEAAYLKAQDMLKKDYWAHVSPEGTKPWQWLGEVGYNYNTAGENLARGFTTNKDIVTAWLDSPSHRNNVLNLSFEEVGFAVVDGKLGGEPTTLVVALYAAPANTAVAGATFKTATLEPTGFVARLGVAMQSLDPLVFGSLLLLLLAMLISLLAHGFRHQLPEHLRASWKRHHGAYKAMLLLSAAIFVVITSMNGQV